MAKSSYCDNILMYLLVGCLFAICLKIYSESDVYNLKCIIAELPKVSGSLILAQI